MPHFREPVLCSEHIPVLGTLHPLSNAPLALAGLIGLNPTGTEGIAGYMNHFYHWEGPTGDAAAPGVGGWIVTSVDGGGDAGESIRVIDSSTYGILRISTNDADGDTTQMALVGEPFKYVAGKRLWFGIRIAQADADDGELAFGLIIQDTNIFSTLPAHGIFFEKAETATAMDFHTRKGGTSTEDTAIDTSAMTDGTFRTYQVYVDEDGNVHYYYEGTKIGTVAAGTATIPDTEDLTLAIQIQAGAVGVDTCDIDWVYAFQER